MAQRIRLSRPRRRRARQTTQPGAWWTRVTPASACALVCMALSFFVVVSFLFSHIEIDEDHHDLIFHLSQETASPSRQISPSKPLQTRHEDSASPPAPTRHQPPAFEDAGAEDGGSAAQQGSDAPPVHPALRGPPAPASDAAAAPGPAQQGECAAFVTEEGTDMPGDDMGSDKVQSVDGCCALCTKEGAACKGFVFIHDSGFCWLKSAAAATVRHAGTTVGRLRSVAPAPRTESAAVQPPAAAPTQPPVAGGDGRRTHSMTARRDLARPGPRPPAEVSAPWLERYGRVEPTACFPPANRDYSVLPITVVAEGSGSYTPQPTPVKGCSIPCMFARKVPADGSLVDAFMGVIPGTGTSSLRERTCPYQRRILFSMESAAYYPVVRDPQKNGYDMSATYRLDSDVPSGYFSWSEYNFMEPLTDKSTSAHAAAFISNCGAPSNRLEVLKELQDHGVKVDSYGQCAHNANEAPGNRLHGKYDALRKHKFSLAFENSKEKDYVTEKYFQSLVAGTIPVVVGAPNVHEYSPAPGAVLAHTDFESTAELAKTMLSIAADPVEFERRMAWKRNGPTPEFIARVDEASTHSHCRICIRVADSHRHQFGMEPSTYVHGPDLALQPPPGARSYLVRVRGQFLFRRLFLDPSAAWPDVTARVDELLRGWVPDADDADNPRHIFRLHLLPWRQPVQVVEELGRLPEESELEAVYIPKYPPGWKPGQA